MHSAGAQEGGLRTPAVAFIIPAFNEEKYLPLTLQSIRTLLSGTLSYETVVVDHGSSDRTVEIARLNGADTHVKSGGTVGGLRNWGAQHSSAPILVFLDADVVLTPSWMAHINQTLAQLEEDPFVITGSTCGIPEDASWLERSWFGPWKTGRASHINSGHLIIARALFERLGGFDESLRTGEDYEFSMRAQQAGAKLSVVPELGVIHNGYPKTLGAFMRREVWHGQSDFDSVRAMAGSPVAIGVFVFAALHAVAVFAAVRGSPVVALCAVAAIVCLCAVASVRQYRHERVSVISSNVVIYYFYFAARFIAFIKAQIGRETFLHRENR
jgi:glycosyltransferase involved in cell wall biosynthesis